MLKSNDKVRVLCAQKSFPECFSFLLFKSLSRHYSNDCLLAKLLSIRNEGPTYKHQSFALFVQQYLNFLGL